MPISIKFIFLLCSLTIIFHGCSPVGKKPENLPVNPKSHSGSIAKPEKKPESPLQTAELSKDDKIIRVGLMENYSKVVFRWTGSCSIIGINGKIIADHKKSQKSWEVAVKSKNLVLTDENNNEEFVLSDKIAVKTDDNDGFIEIAGVKEGKGWHWEKSKTRRYRGCIEFVLFGKNITVVNELPLNHYLYGVVPSEMPHEAPFEALKAQAILARTNTYSTLGDKYKNKPYQLFNDVFSQVYGGLTNENPVSNKAVDATSGLILTYDNKPIEATFHSVCGGYMEASDWIWSGKPMPYLSAHPDDTDSELPADISSEKAFRNFIDNPPKSFCNMNSRKYPHAFDYAKKYFRWQKIYSRKELERTIYKNAQKVTGQNKKIGSLKNIIVLLRGKSGKIRKMKIVGTNSSFEVTKELNIRKLLANSPLYSANFYIDIRGDENGLPKEFILKGAGFGHSGGMCQIGAVGMAIDGYKYQDILEFYFLNSKVTKLIK